MSDISEGFGFTTFRFERDPVVRTYATDSRNVEFLMGYYPILDRTPTGRGEGDAFQMWPRRHDEYGHE